VATAHYRIVPFARSVPHASGRCLSSLPNQPNKPSRLAWLLAAMREAWRRQRSRQRLADLDAHILKDIGVTYAEAEFEANKPFWRS
jgi:uncharacterized protein YjiS (DUF1127 family)